MRENCLYVNITDRYCITEANECTKKSFKPDLLCIYTLPTCLFVISYTRHMFLRGFDDGKPYFWQGRLCSPKKKRFVFCMLWNKRGHFEMRPFESGHSRTNPEWNRNGCSNFSWRIVLMMNHPNSATVSHSPFQSIRQQDIYFWLFLFDRLLPPSRTTLSPTRGSCNGWTGCRTRTTRGGPIRRAPSAPSRSTPLGGVCSAVSRVWRELSHKGNNRHTHIIFYKGHREIQTITVP